MTGDRLETLRRMAEDRPGDARGIGIATRRGHNGLGEELQEALEDLT